MLWLCFKVSSCLFGNTRDMSVMHEKAKFVRFIYIKPQKMKFKSVQINMKQVSYMQGKTNRTEIADSSSLSDVIAA